MLYYKDCWGAAPVREWRKQRCSRNAGQITLRIEGETVIEGDGGGKWSRAEVILLVIDSVLFFQQPRNFARNGKCGTNNLSIIQHACAIYLDFLHLRSAKRIETPAILIDGWLLSREMSDWLDGKSLPPHLPSDSPPARFSPSPSFPPSSSVW